MENSDVPQESDSARENGLQRKSLSHGMHGSLECHCNSHKYENKEECVLPTFGKMEGSHTPETRAPPAEVLESQGMSGMNEYAATRGVLFKHEGAPEDAAANSQELSGIFQLPAEVRSWIRTLRYGGLVRSSPIADPAASLQQVIRSDSSHMHTALPSLHRTYTAMKLPLPPPPDAGDHVDVEKCKVLQLSAEDQSCLATEGKSTFFQATLNCLSLLYGLGILSSPYAVQKAGWMGAIISLIVATTYAYSAHLMARCVEYDPACSSYQDIAKLVLGKRMRKFITALFYIEIMGTLLGYCISMGDNLDYIFPNIGFRLPGLSNRNFMIFMVALIILPSVWLRDLSALSFTSVWCIASSVLLLVAVMLAATLNHIGFSHPLPFLRIQGVPVAAGLYAFSYGGTSVFPSVCKSMKDPSQFTKVIALSFCIATASIAGLGVAGAYMFGEGTKSQVTLSMPSHFITTKIVLWMTILTPIFKFALQLSPITTAVEAQIYKHLGNKDKATSRTVLFVLSTLMRSSVLAFIVILSMILPYFQYIIALVGSSMTIAICMIFPCLFYLRLYWKTLSYHVITFIIVLIVFGMIVGACGTVVAFQGLVNCKQSHIHS